MSSTVSNRWVFVAEGQTNLLALIKQDLEEANLHVVTASSFSQAALILADTSVTFNLAIIDLSIDGGDVLDLMRTRREAGSTMPFIVTSTQVNKQVVLDCVRAGAFDFLEKPYSLGTGLTPLVLRALDASLLILENSHLSEQILHSSKLAALGELSATVLHDIRGPLSLIQMVSEDLEETLKSDGNVSKETVEEALENIKKACERIHKLGNHLRNYAREDLQEALEEIEAEELMRNASFLVQQKMRTVGVKFFMDIPVELSGVTIHCFPNKMEQVLMNLMSNACDAMEVCADKKLKLRLSEEKETLTFHVEDTGPGMSEEIQQKIFESFFTTKPKGKGTGLGLKIVRDIVTEHGGELKVTSIVGKGTVFSVSLRQNLRLLKQA
jgi:two-component system, NtrC family, sensor kinase